MPLDVEEISTDLTQTYHTTPIGKFQIEQQSRHHHNIEFVFVSPSSILFSFRWCQEK